MTAQPANNTADSASDLTAIGKYRLLATLAQGGMGKVYLGLMAGPAGFNKLLVIKVMTRTDDLPGEDHVQQFLDEARLAARAIHSNIVGTYEVGEANGHYFLAMEYLDGQSLRTLQGRLPNERIQLVAQLRILSEVARGLQYAHELKDYKGEPLGVVHRDVSPQNVFITYDGQVKLLDFGIAKSYDAGHQTKVGVVKGKLDYIAPEQLRGDHIDSRADIFALGVMLWEAVTGMRFSGGRGTPEVRKMHARLTGGELKLSAVAPETPEALVSLIERAIAVNPSDRWLSAGEVADALDTFIESTGQRPNAKALSEAMTGIFADERKRMHKLIEEQIEETRGSFPSSRPLPTLNLTGMSTLTPSASQLSRVDGESTRDDALVERASHAASGARRVAEAEAPVSKLRWGVGAALAAAVVAVALLLEEPSATKLPPDAGHAPQPTNATGVVEHNAAKPLAEAPVQEAAGIVMIRITASPSHAQLTLDGVQVALPFQGEFRASTELHRIEVAAKGHQRDTRLVDFSKDQTIDFELAPSFPRVRRDGRNSARASAAAADSQPSAPPQSGSETRQVVDEDVPVKPRAKATIDVDNPY